MADRSIEWDSALPGFGVVTMAATGRESFVYQWRDLYGSHRMKLTGRFIQFEIDREKHAGIKSKITPVPAGKFTRKDAKREAEIIRGAIGRGRNPLKELQASKSAAENSLKSVCEEYLKRAAKNLRSHDQIKASLERLVYPKLGARPIDSILRSEIVKLLDKIADERGPVMADRVLAYVRKVMNWHASRSDDFRSPIVRGMARTKPGELERDRILTDDELRAVWKAAKGFEGPFGYFVRFVLLTATRRNEAADMTDAELSGDDWIIPGSRYKNKLDHLIPLSQAARDLLKEIPRIKGVSYIFTTGRGAIGGFSKFKKDFDKACGVADWTIHDLRRTARSLMSRAGVPADHAERALGHVIGGVRGTYDRHAYYDEKKRAFEALALQIDRILNPKDNVIPMRTEVPA